MYLNLLALLLGCALVIFGAVQIVRNDDALRLLSGRGVSIRALLENPNIKVVIIGVIIAAVGWFAD